MGAGTISWRKVNSTAKDAFDCLFCAIGQLENDPKLKLLKIMGRERGGTIFY